MQKTSAKNSSDLYATPSASLRLCASFLQAVHCPDDPVLHQGGAKVEQIAGFFACEPQIGLYLFAVGDAKQLYK